MKTHLSGVLALTCGILLALTASPALAKKGGNRPGGGGQDPPPNPAPVEYQLTWIPGINDGRMDIYDCNTAGIAVGGYQDETGTVRPFWTTADGGINPLDNWWVLPPGYEGWRVQGHQMQINDANMVCGGISNDQTSEDKLFLANLSDPDSLEPVGPVLGFRPWWLYMNEHGDVAFWTYGPYYFSEGGTLNVYVRSLDKMFCWAQEDVGESKPTGINDNLQVSLVYNNWEMGGHLSGSRRLTFDVAQEEAVIEDLGSAETIYDPITAPWGGITNDGTVFGYFETKARRIRFNGGRMVSRTADATAGFITADGNTWSELDARLPIGSSLYKAAASPLDVNEFGQVVGGYQCTGRYVAEDLWLLDPEDGLFDVNDLVVGNAAEVEAFRAASDFRYVRITEIDPDSGYGIISGSASSSGPGFILTPRLVEQP